jgi:hypothetical protein
MIGVDVVIKTHGANDWKPVAADTGADIALSYQCPTCLKTQFVSLQRLPWSFPVEEELHEDVDGQFTVAEFRRAAGSVVHEERTRVATQLWCHFCSQGADVELEEA